jgi:hypothetical protein
MKRTIFAWTIAMLVTTAPLLAQRGGGAPQAPKPQVAKPQAAKTQVTKTQPPKVQGPKTTPQSPKTTSKPASAGPQTQPRGASSTKTTPSMKPSKTTSKTNLTTAKTTGKSSGSAGATPTSASKTTTTTTTLTPVQQKLQRNTNLASKLQSRLPAGTDLQAAAAGFRNLGQFVAAVNVSSNLGIPFTALKTRMVDQGMSLGQAIQDARPATTDTTLVVRRAESDADDLIGASAPKDTKTKSTKKPGGRK